MRPMQQLISIICLAPDGGGQPVEGAGWTAQEGQKMEPTTGTLDRTAEQILSDHRAALAAGDVDHDVQCNYAPDAVVISDTGVDRGRDAIRRSLRQIASFFGDVVPVVNSQTIVQLDDVTAIARVLFSVKTPAIEVTDGVDTYVIRNGQIHCQTAHGRPVFHSDPFPLLPETR
jgi:ketosteroid isomerase-like protein